MSIIDLEKETIITIIYPQLIAKLIIDYDRINRHDIARTKLAIYKVELKEESEEMEFKKKAEIYFQEALLRTGYVGIHCVALSLGRNSNKRLKVDPPIPKIYIAPWEPVEMTRERAIKEIHRNNLINQIIIKYDRLNRLKLAEKRLDKYRDEMHHKYFTDIYWKYGTLTVGQALKNPYLQLGSNITPKITTSPWSQSSIEADANRKYFDYSI